MTDLQNDSLAILQVRKDVCSKKDNKKGLNIHFDAVSNNRGPKLKWQNRRSKQGKSFIKARFED